MQNQRRSFLVSIITISCLMIFTYVLTLILECDGISFIKFVLSPILALSSSSGSTTIAVLIFLLIIGGITNGLNKCGFMEYMLNKIVHKYGKRRYTLMFVMVLFLMIMGSVVGTFEEIVPVTPIVVSLAINLGFDAFTGLGMSLLAVGCGFAAGVFNPFTVGVAQELAGLPMFSGATLRIISFVLIYVLLMFFLYTHAKKIEKDINEDVANNFIEDNNMEKAYKAFVVIFSIAIIIVLSSPVLTFLQDYTLIIVALMFLIAGIVSIKLTKTSNKQLLNFMKEGVIDILPSAVLILMAASIKYTMEESGVLNNILTIISNYAASMNRVELILFIYLICLILEIFVPSGSAKAFLLIPLLTPIGIKYGIDAQIIVLAFAYGDGFSNVFYPTNPALIISLSLTNISYRDWFKYSWKFQLANLVLTGILLVL